MMLTQELQVLQLWWPLKLPDVLIQKGCEIMMSNHLLVVIAHQASGNTWFIIHTYNVHYTAFVTHKAVSACKL